MYSAPLSFDLNLRGLAALKRLTGLKIPSLSSVYGILIREREREGCWGQAEPEPGQARTGLSQNWAEPESFQRSVAWRPRPGRALACNPSHGDLGQGRRWRSFHSKWTRPGRALACAPLLGRPWRAFRSMAGGLGLVLACAPLHGRPGQTRRHSSAFAATLLL
jgi:hypothetical protein